MIDHFLIKVDNYPNTLEISAWITRTSLSSWEFEYLNKKRLSAYILFYVDVDRP